MTVSDLEVRLELAKLAAKSGAEHALPRYAVYETLEIVSKGKQDRVTEVDRVVEETIRGVIRAHFPDDAILGEELGADAGLSTAEPMWVVDPIDGTDCFVFGLPMWSISIAWVEEGAVKAGVVYDPVHDEMFAARTGGGGQLNGRPIHASRATDLAAGLVGIGHSSRVAPERTLKVLERLMHRGGLFHRCGSGALSLAWVAAGRLLGYHEAHINSWDCLSGILLVQEAGGWHSDFLSGNGLMKGNPLTASGPNLIEAMKEVAGG